MLSLSNGDSPVSILSIIEEVASTTKKLEKKAIFQREIGNVLFGRVCVVAYDPRINFYIRQFSMPKFHAGSHDLNTAIDLVLENIASRKFTGYTALSYVESVLSWLDANDAEVLARILRRDLRMGASESTINDTWPNSIPEYPVMLCQADKPKARAKIKFPAIAQLKSDGLRINVIVVGGQVQYLSRSGKTVSCQSPEVDASFIDLADQYGDVMVFDGELLWLDDVGNIAPREIGNGKASKATRGEMSDADRGRFVFSLWDAIPLDVRDEKKKSLNYDDRFSLLHGLVTALDLDGNPRISDRIRLIEFKLIPDWESAEDFFAEVLALGQEGLIIKNLDGFWENDRSDDCVKMKAIVENDFEIIGWNPGRGKYEGQIGSFQMATADRGVVFNCAGMPDDIRAGSPESFLGKIAAVKYNMVMPSKNGRPRSVFLPRVIEVRDDKTVADIL